TVSLAGWWMVAVSRAQLLLRPSLSLHPSQGVSLGDNVTPRCHLTQLVAWVALYKEGHWIDINNKSNEQDTAEFSLNTNREHAGTYWCQYRLSWSGMVSERSDPVELLVTDHRFPPPSISLSPEECVETGTNVTIQCWNKDYGAAFLLHKDGCSAPIQRQDLDVVGTATFTIIGVTPADSGTYRCSYHPWGHPFLSSHLGSNVTLEVTPTPASPVKSEHPILETPKHPDATGAEEQSSANLVLALLKGFVAALIFGLAVFFIIDARSISIQKDENCGEEGFKCPPSPPDSSSVPCLHFYPI
ncbi:T-cell-interacting, activating receptor on myeloid cells protein 1-like, partial [Phasianus colchicus]|uniref:T-cell-interacting, activating receptor on myeloid cells protein 1-like n=1 Tax=Phasianus colchicus TaxID=9054 RepID=UPI00129DBC36